MSRDTEINHLTYLSSPIKKGTIERMQTFQKSIKTFYISKFVSYSFLFIFTLVTGVLQILISRAPFVLGVIHFTSDVFILDDITINMYLITGSSFKNNQ